MTEEITTTSEPTLDKDLRNRAWKDVTLYGLARLGLFVALTLIIQYTAYFIGAPVPLLISALLGLLVAFPLSMFLFKGLRLRVNEEIAQWDKQRKEHRAWVRKELSER